jgi:flagellin
MSFSIQTNVNSIVAQENLRVNSNFQAQTIQRLTSGYRINSSADDAAGLAIANKFRNDTAELTQGVRNANDGVSQLQIMDGGMNNIGKMLDRLKTLATQSASDSFTGDRGVLNKEYQTLVGEIDRQSQAIGLSTGGHFAKSLNVYIGGGTNAAGASDTTNGVVGLDLANSVVDSKALGLRTSEFKASPAVGTNLAAASNTSIANIVTANSGDSGVATFQLSGAGFSTVKVSITAMASDTTATLTDKLNSAIQAAGNAGGASANALRTANIQAKAVTDSSGNQQITFTSAGSAFQATAGTATANAIMGNFDTTSTNPAKGASVSQSVQGAAVGTGAAVNYVNLKVFVDGTEKDLNVKLAASDNTDAEYQAAVRGANGYTALSNLGVTATVDTTTHKLNFTGSSNQSIHVEAAGDTTNTLGFGAWQQGTAVTGGATVTPGATQTATMTLHVDGTDYNLSVATDGTEGTAAAVLGKLTGDGSYTALQAAGITASVDGSNRIVFSGKAGQAISVTAVGDAGNVLGYGIAASTATASFGTITPGAALSAGSANDKATVAFSINGGDKILVSVTSTGNLASTADALQTAINANQQLSAAGITVGANLASISAGASTTNFRMTVESQTGTLNLGLGTGVSSPATYRAVDKASMLASAGSSQTGLGTTNDVFSFSGLTNKGGVSGANADQQVISFGAAAADGTAKSTSVTLNATNGYDVDTAIATINSGLQASGDPTLKQIVAVKETNAGGTAEGIRFISSLNNFSVGVGTANNSTAQVSVGMFDGTAGATTKQGNTVQSGNSGAADISTKDGATQAVITLGNAVKQLGVAQAAIGKGQNQLSYAIGLAQSQISNFSAAQSQIRDADVAAEAANLTKAQVLQQASMAAMAQANSAPQAVMALLRG